MIADNFLFSTILTNHSSNIDAFIEQWSGLYSYKDMHLYEDATPKYEFTADDVLNLFRWKNGMPLSSKKKELIEKKQ